MSISGTIRPAHQSTSNRNITYAAHLMGYNRKIQQPGSKFRPLLKKKLFQFTSKTLKHGCYFLSINIHVDKLLWKYFACVTIFQATALLAWKSWYFYFVIYFLSLQINLVDKYNMQSVHYNKVSNSGGTGSQIKKKTIGPLLKQ